MSSVLPRAFCLSLLTIYWLVILEASPSSSSSAAAAAAPQQSPLTREDVVPIVVGVDGGTESIRACCFNAKDGRMIGSSCAVPYSTTHPQPGWAEQSPTDWWACMGEAVRGAVASIKEGNYKNHEIRAICVDTTCCSVVALDDDCEPLRPCLLWMDQRSASQCQEILDLAQGDPALQVNAGGEGPLSAEWLIPKALWLKQKEPEIYHQARYICEYQDYINFKMDENKLRLL